MERIVLGQLAAHGGDCDAAWQHQLAMQFRGTTVRTPDGRVHHFSFAATPDEVFAVACDIAHHHAATRRPTGPHNASTP